MQLVAKAFPQQAAIEKVVEVATDFWRTHPHKHIAIHCAYGEEPAAGLNCSRHHQACPAGSTPAKAHMHVSQGPAVLLRSPSPTSCQ